MTIDFHCHSRFSYDSLTSPRALEGAMQRRGCDRIAVTDHDAYGFHHSPRSAVFIRAQEIKTEHGDIIGLFLEDEVFARRAGCVIKEIKRKGGLAVLPHPYRYKNKLRMPDSLLLQFDLIEVLNGRCTALQNLLALDLAARLGIPSVAGSDAHRASEVGRVTVSLPGVNGSHENEVKAALLAKETLIQGRSATDLRRFLDRLLGIATRRVVRWR